MKTLVVSGIQPGSSVGLFYNTKKQPLQAIKVEKDVSGEFRVKLPFRFRDLFKRRPFVLRVRHIRWAFYEQELPRKNTVVRFPSIQDVLLDEPAPPYFQKGTAA